MNNPKAPVIVAIFAVLALSTHTPMANAQHNEGQANFDKYAKAVETLSKTAGPEYRAVISTVRIPAGTTIEAKWLQQIPLIEYRQTDTFPEPYLVRRTNDEFASIDEVAGKIATQDIEERGKIKRSQVGTTDQLKTGSETPLKIHYYFRRGAVLPGAPAEVHECTLNTSNMPAKEASELRKRIARSNVLVDSTQKYQVMAGGYENYLLEITTDSVTKKISWSGKNAPASIKVLVDYLEAHSKKKSIPASKEFLQR